MANKLSNVRGDANDKLVRRAVPMGRSSQTVKYTNPKKKGIQTNIYGSTCLVKDGVCALLIDLDDPLRGVMLWLMRISSYGVGVVLLHDI